MPQGRSKSLPLFIAETGLGSRVNFRRISLGGYPGSWSANRKLDMKLKKSRCFQGFSALDAMALLRNCFIFDR